MVFPDVRVDEGGERTLYIDYTVNGTRTFQVSVNGGPPAEATVTDIGNNTPRTRSLPITLQPGTNTITVGNAAGSAPDLDRLSLGPRGGTP